MNKSLFSIISPPSPSHPITKISMYNTLLNYFIYASQSIQAPALYAKSSTKQVSSATSSSSCDLGKEVAQCIWRRRKNMHIYIYILQFSHLDKKYSFIFIFLSYKYRFSGTTVKRAVESSYNYTFFTLQSICYHNTPLPGITPDSCILATGAVVLLCVVTVNQTLLCSITFNLMKLMKWIKKIFKTI